MLNVKARHMARGSIAISFESLWNRNETHQGAVCALLACIRPHAHLYKVGNIISAEVSSWDISQDFNSTFSTTTAHWKKRS